MPFLQTCYHALPSLHLALKDLEVQGRGKQQTLSLRWPFRLSGLIEATQRGCAFCAFILKQFFDAIAFTTWNYEPKKPWYADPSKHQEERLRVVNHAMISMTKLKTDRFVFFVTPSGAKRGVELPDFDKLEISMDKKSLEAHGLEELRKARIFQPGALIKNVTAFSTKGKLDAEKCLSFSWFERPGFTEDCGKQMTLLRSTSPLERLMLTPLPSMA